jgi:uncharacterized protein (TIGR02266 family)
VRPLIADRPSRRYRRLTLLVDVGYTGPDGPRLDTATTLGAGGLFIETDTPLEEGIELRLHFSLPDGGQNFDIAGRVVWCRRPTDRHGQTSGMGIEFTERESVVALALELERL